MTLGLCSAVATRVNIAAFWMLFWKDSNYQLYSHLLHLREHLRNIADIVNVFPWHAVTQPWTLASKLTERQGENDYFHVRNSGYIMAICRRMLLINQK
jgi:hypothetical protein